MSEARIESVQEGSPADDAGFTAGYAILAVDGEPVRDLIDWRWLSSEDCMTLSYRDAEGGFGEVELDREPGEDWGFEFEGVIFDKIKTCRNNCLFCFMRQLPEDARPSLKLRDDDFRLSFLTGTFATLTNLTDDDRERIIAQRISPLRVSLHAISPELRERLIGRHAGKGIEECERLLHAGIEMHMQIVLLPGLNDGHELEKSLAWAYGHEGIASVGIVPLGFTRHQSTFEASFNDPQAAQGLLATIAPFQKRAEAERGAAWVYAADEFYRNAYPENLMDMLPQTSHYGDFDMYEDGIGIIRSAVDDWQAASQAAAATAATLKARGQRVHQVIGEAMCAYFPKLVAQSPLDGLLVPFPVRNGYFGGNVDVTGLLCGCDIARALREAAAAGERISLAVVPSVVFNDDGVTLDGMALEDVRREAGVPLAVVSCIPSDYLLEIDELVKRL